MKHNLLILFTFSTSLLFGQKRMELLETNIPIDKITAYADSYLWTKNWWLTNGIMVDTTQGGNSLSQKSKLTKAGIDSLGKEFRKSLSPNLIRFGNFIPRITTYNSPKQIPYIKVSFYEIEQSSVKLLSQLILEFGTHQQNNMKEVLNIFLLDPKVSIPVSKEFANSLYNRKPNRIELEMTPPQVSTD